MLTLRKASDRGGSDLGWLNSKHTFSFGEYHDPEHMGFGYLRVINDDRVAPGGGFATHPHRDMEIISYVLEGALEHRDSMGNGSVIRPGDVQRMSAGTGVTHSEFNQSRVDPVHFLQIWFLPDRQGHAPGYEQKTFAREQKRGQFCLVASAKGRNGSVSLNQDVDMSVVLLEGDEHAGYTVGNGRDVWLHVACGRVTINGQVAQEGDGLSTSAAGELLFSDGERAEIVLFDMASRA